MERSYVMCFFFKQNIFYQWNHIYLMKSNEIQTSVIILHQENTDDKECLTLNA